MIPEIDRRTFLALGGSVPAGWWTLDRVRDRTARYRAATREGATGVDWTHPYHDPAQTAATPDGVGPTGDVRVDWTYDSNGRPGNPVLHDGRLYFTDYDLYDDGSGSRGVFVALNAADGSVAWQRTRSELEYTPFEIAVADGTIVGNHGPLGEEGTTTDTGLVAYEAGTGKRKWETKPRGEVRGPVLAGGTAFVGGVMPEGSSYIHARNVDDGSERWRASDPNPGPIVVADGHVHTVSSRSVRAYDVGSGRRQWQWMHRPSEIDGESVGLLPRIAADAGRLYLSTGAGQRYGVPVVAVSTADGTLLSSNAFDGFSPAQLVVADDAVYVVGEQNGGGGRVYALSKDLSEELWNYRSDRVGTFRPPIVVGDEICLFDANLRLYALDRHTGDPIWQFQDKSFEIGNVAASGGNVFAGTNHKFFALRGDGIAVSADANEMVAGFSQRVRVSLTNSHRRRLTDVSLEPGPAEGTDDGDSATATATSTSTTTASTPEDGGSRRKLREFRAEGIPSSIPALESESATVAFRARQGASGPAGVRIRAEGQVEGTGNAATGRELTNVTVHEPFELDASVGAITDPVLAGDEATFKFEVVGNPVRKLPDVGFQVDLGALPGTWSVDSARDDRFSAPDRTNLDVYPDMGRWEWSPVDAEMPYWSMDLPAEMTQRPGLTVQVPPDVDEGEYTLPVTGYAFGHDEGRRWAVESVEATFEVVQNYVDATLDGPEDPRTFNEEVPFDLSLEVQDEPLEDLSVTVSGLPPSLGLEGHEDDGGEFSEGDDAVTWEWSGRTEAGATLEPSATFRVADDAEGGTYDVRATVGGTPTTTEGDVDEEAATSVGIQGLDWYVDQKTALADRLDALSADSFDESPAVETVLDGIVRKAESGDVADVAAAKTIERLIYAEEATERVLVAMRTIDADVDYNGSYNYEVSYKTAKAALNTLVYGLLVAVAVELAVARISAFLGGFVSAAVSGVASSVKGVLTSVLGSTAGKIAFEGLWGAVDDAVGAIPGTASQFVANVADAVDPVIEATADWMASAVVRRGSHLGRQLQTVASDDYAYVADRKGNHSTAKDARFATVGEVTTDARTTADVISNFTETPGEDIARSLIDIASFDEGGGVLGKLLGLVKDVLGLFANVVDAIVDLAFGYPAALGFGISSHYVIEGTYATGVTAITNGTEPDLNVRLGRGVGRPPTGLDSALGSLDSPNGPDSGGSDR